MEIVDPALSDSASLLDGLLRVSQIVRLRFNDWLAQFDLNDGRYAVLKTLSNAAEGGSSQAELAERLGQSESNVSTLIERMQRDGLVDRLRSEADRRKRVLLVSPKGRLMLGRVEERRSAWASRLWNGISAADRSSLLTLLRQLGCGLDTAFKIPSDEVATKLMGGEPSIEIHRRTDPTDDPRSPQFALQQMLLALSSHAETESIERDAA